MHCLPKIKLTQQAEPEINEFSNKISKDVSLQSLTTEGKYGDKPVIEENKHDSIHIPDKAV